MTPSRRRLLRAAAGGLAALAGCPDGPTDTSTAPGTGPAQGTSTEPGTATGPGTATASGTPTGPGTSSPTGTPGPTTPVDVLLDGAPNGLRKYSLTLSTSALVGIGSVRPGLLDGGEFEVVAGGAGEPTVTVRAADLAETVGSFAGTETLATVVFDGDVSRSQLDLTVATLVDDAGAAMDAGRVSLSVSR